MSDAVFPERLHPTSECIEADVVVVDDRIGMGAALRACGLLAHHRAHCQFAPTRPGTDPCLLRRLATVDDPDPVDAHCPTAGLDQQRYVEYHDRGRRCVCLALGFRADHRMQDRFEAQFGVGVREHQIAHACAVECACRVDERRTEAFLEGGDCRTSGRRKLASDQIGIDDCGTEFG